MTENLLLIKANLKIFNPVSVMQIEAANESEDEKDIAIETLSD